MSTPMVLIVAANPFLRSLLKDLLEANGVFAACGSTPVEARRLIERFGPTLVLVDGDLPGSDLALIAEDLPGDVRLLVLAERVQLARNGAWARVDAVIPKPIDTGLFSRAVLNELRHLARAADQPV